MAGGLRRSSHCEQKPQFQPPLVRPTVWSINSRHA